MHTVQKKICLLGDFAVGKTSLVRQFVEGRFDDKYLSTIGVKISRKPMLRADHVLNLLIWDLAGGDDYSKMGSHYLRGAVGALIVCDLTRPDTLDALTVYAQQLRAINSQAQMVFIGNKADLEDARRISDDQLQAAVAAWQLPYLLTSAKTGLAVEAAFEQLARQIEPQL
ncbi:MAG: GTP-binding protein [Anaerolineales bacterium]|nr:GTP-binding protein [Anaerolineales bacterium]